MYTEILFMQDCADQRWVARGILLDDFHGIIAGRTIIRDNDLLRRESLVQRAIDCFSKEIDLVVGSNNDRYFRAHGAAPRGMAKEPGAHCQGVGGHAYGKAADLARRLE